MFAAAWRPSLTNNTPGESLVLLRMIRLDPDLRFERHKAGVQANRYVLQYGQRLLPHLYEVYNPMPYAAACEMEMDLGMALREASYGVCER